MKQLFILFFLFFLIDPGKIVAQGNLQFNQVIFYNIPLNTSQAFVVPVGKVWKIESSATSDPSSSGFIRLRDASSNNLCYLNGSPSGSGNIPFPFWLPSSFSGSFFAGNQRGMISIIEFNVVQ